MHFWCVHPPKKIVGILLLIPKELEMSSQQQTFNFPPGIATLGSLLLNGLTQIITLLIPALLTKDFFHFLPINKQGEGVEISAGLSFLLFMRKKRRKSVPNHPPQAFKAAFLKHPKETPLERRDRRRPGDIFASWR